MKLLFAATLLLIAVFGSDENSQDKIDTCPVEMKEIVEDLTKYKNDLVEVLKNVQKEITEEPCEVEKKEECEDLKNKEVKEIQDVITEIVADKIPTAKELCETKAKTDELVELFVESMQTEDEDKLKEIEAKSDKLMMNINGMTQEELDQAKEQAKEQQKAMEKQMKEMMENIEPMMKQLEPVIKELEPMMEMMLGNIMQMTDGRVDVGSVPTITEIDGQVNRLIKNE